MHPAAAIAKKGEWFEATCSFCEAKGECRDDCPLFKDQATAQAQLAAKKKADDSGTSGSSSNENSSSTKSAS